MSKLADHPIEYGIAPLSAVSLDDALDAMRCPDCVGPVEALPTDGAPPLIRVTHDTTCLRGRDIMRRQAAEVVAANKAKAKKKAAKAARKTTKKGKKK